MPKIWYGSLINEHIQDCDTKYKPAEQAKN